MKISFIKYEKEENFKIPKLFGMNVEEEIKELEGEEEYEPTIQNEPVETGEDNEEEVELGDANSSNLPDNKSSKE